MATAPTPAYSPVSQYPVSQAPDNSVASLVTGRDKWTKGGVNVQYLEVQGVRTKFQTITINVTAADKRYPFETQAHVTNDRITGIILTSDEYDAASEEQKYINRSTIQLSIDNEEIVPDGFDTSLISAKMKNSIYDNMYRINERADGALVKGTFTCGKRIGETFKPFTLKIYLFSLTKPKK